jgi:hypothetical protein
MISSKRLTVATIIGLLCGIACYYIVTFMGAKLQTSAIPSIILNRTLIGFIIGISAIRVHYIVHGIIIGLIGSLPLAIPMAVTEPVAIFHFMVFGVIWGIIIEWGTTKLFKAPAPSFIPPENY